MKALIKPDYGPGMHIEEVSLPEIGPDDVLIKVQAASICGSDLHMYEGASGYDWINVPLVPGHEFAGIIAEVGDPASSALLGKRVVVNPYISCGECDACYRGQTNLCDGVGSPMDKVPARSLTYGFRQDGGMAEYAAVKKSNVLFLPEECPMEIAGMLEAIGISVHAIERSSIKPGDSAVVIGPGPIGLALVTILANYGLSCLIVTGLQADEKRLKLAQTLGATDLIYADACDDVEEVRQITEGAGIDFVFETSGFAGAMNRGIKMLRKEGELLLIGITSQQTHLMTNELVRGELTIKGVYGVTRKTLKRTLDMAASGKYEFSKLITYTVPLEKVLLGFEYGKKRDGAKVIIKP